MKRASVLSALLISAVASSVAGLRAQAAFTTFTTSQNGAILTVTLNNKVTPVNEFSLIMSFELDQLVTSLQTDNSTKVVIFRSGNPKFFIAGFDIIPRPGALFPFIEVQILCA